jgi:hypothetical protein
MCVTSTPPKMIRPRAICSIFTMALANVDFAPLADQDGVEVEF